MAPVIRNLCTEWWYSYLFVHRRHCIAPNVWLILCNELEGMCEEAVGSNLMICRGICLCTPHQISFG